MRSDVCRVAVHSGGGHIDVVLPNAIPVALLMPGLCDIVAGTVEGADRWPPGLLRQLCRPGLPPLDTSKTLSENGIQDGATLVLTTWTPPVDVRPALDSAEQLLRLTTSHDRNWTPDASQAAALTVTVALAGVAGFLAVPGPPGIPHLLLAASTAGVAAAIAARVAVRGRTAFGAQAFGFALFAAGAACAGAFGDSAHHTGLLLTMVSTGVLVSSGRVALIVCGQSRSVTRDLDLDTDARAGQSPAAPECLTALVLATTATTSIGVLMTVWDRPDQAGCLLTTAVSGALLLRARAQRSPPHRAALVAAGTFSAAVTLITLGRVYPTSAPWLCAVAGVAALAVVPSFAHRAAKHGMSPVGAHVIEMVERTMLVSVIPLAAWGLDLYDRARALVQR
jgi:hypothetical protein